LVLQKPAGVIRPPTSHISAALPMQTMPEISVEEAIIETRPAAGYLGVRATVATRSMRMNILSTARIEHSTLPLLAHFGL
jgi:hypothetical protein